MARCRAFRLAALLLLMGSTAAAGAVPKKIAAAPPAGAPRRANATVSPEEASRFLSQATLGATWDEIQRTAGIGFEAWLDEQFEKPLGYEQPYLDERLRSGLEITSEHRRWAWWQQVMEGPDPLRQRVALALSEVFVVSDGNDTVGANPIGLANYYDMLLRDSFGNYRQLLQDVTTHPIMGTYLSHLRNAKSDPASGRFPDENYAREIMQLFSIGLFQLKSDGTYLLSGAGQPIPTYDNGDITELAKIMTGLSFDGADSDFYGGQESWTVPMRMYESFHEPGSKYLIRGKYVPPGQTGMKDLGDALDNLFQHPNVGPFLSRRLIQRLVTSNPSPDYVERVSAVFANDGSGVRGDLKAVLRAILLDPEARTWPVGGGIERGRLQESFLRRVHLARAFEARNLASSYPISDFGAPSDFGQRPVSSPTVFNFFLPDHQPAGEIADAGLFAPEFQILTTVTAISSSNELRSEAYDVLNYDGNPSLEVRLDLNQEIGIASDVRALLDRLDLVLMYGNMSQPMRDVLIGAVSQLTEPEARARMAVHLIAISPEYNVVK